MFSKGMFLDGLIYAAISKNLANGVGSYLNLYLSETFFKEFNEHPPLFFFIQAQFFRLIGDHPIFPEFLYMFVNTVITIYFMYKLWIEVVTVKYKSYFWMPLFLWASYPLVTWAYYSNLLEITMTTFLVASIYYQVLFVKYFKYWYLVISSILILLAFLTKGPTALYPFSFIFFYYLVSYKITLKQMLISTILIILVSVLLFLIYLYIFDANEYFIKYFNSQFNAVKSFENGTSSRFYVIKMIFTNELLITYFIMITMYYIVKKNSIKVIIDENIKILAIVLLLVVLSAVLPISISKKQRLFYSLSIYPLMAVAVAALFVQITHEISVMKLIKLKYIIIFKRVTYLIAGLSIGLSIYVYNYSYKYEKWVSDLDKIISYVTPKNEKLTIGACNKLFPSYILPAYFSRYSQLSFTNSLNYKYIIFINQCDKLNDKLYKLVKLNNNEYYLYKKIGDINE